MKVNLLQYLGEKKYSFEAVLPDFPQVKKLRGVPQNPEYHGEGDAFVHTKLVCEAVSALEEWDRLTAEEKGILFLAALFHDIGKMACTRTEDGFIRSPGHTVTGAKIFRELCYKSYADSFLIEFRIREEIAFLIRHHGLPPLFMEKESMDRYLVKTRESVRFRLLYLLSKADILGRQCANGEGMLSTVEYFKEYTEELGCYREKVAFQDDYTKFRYFSGAKIWFGERLYDETEFPVYVMMGLPLAGKDTYIRENLSGLPEISLDGIREEWNISPESGSRRVVAEARERAKIQLRKKQSFVWNATNLTADNRRKVCSMCQDYGARVILIYIEVPYAQLLKRNKIRERSVPEKVIDGFIRKMDMLEPGEAHETRYYVKTE